MSGKAGGRGYLIQALISLLDALTNDSEWTSITLEPNLSSDKVDILWQYPARRKVTQVKSSQNTISVPDVKTWAEELEASTTADEYEIRLIGPVSQGVTTLAFLGKVRVPTPQPLNLDGLVHQAAHQLDRYLQSRRLGVQKPSIRELVVEASSPAYPFLRLRELRWSAQRLICCSAHGSARLPKSPSSRRRLVASGACI